jgi:hypothetical protein
MQAAAFIALISINVVSDAVSLIWTKRCIAMLVIPRAKLTVRRLLWVLTQDLSVAVFLMGVVQIISNALYAVQIGRPGEFWSYMKDWRTALKPYAAVDPSFSTIEFPGQLIITCTTYFPALFFYFLCVLVLLLAPFYKVAILLLEFFKIDTKNQSCSQLGFISSLLTIGGLAVGSCAVLIGAWPLIKPY